MRICHFLLLISLIALHSCNEVPPQKADRFRDKFAGVFVDSADFPNRGMTEYDTLVIRNINTSYPDSFYICHYVKIINTFTTVSVKPVIIRDSSRIKYDPSCKCLQWSSSSIKIDVLGQEIQINKRKYKRIQ